MSIQRFSGTISDNGAMVPFPLQAGQKVNAHMKQDPNCDADLVLQLHGKFIAYHQGAGKGKDRVLTDVVIEQSSNDYQFLIQRYTPEDAPIGSNWSLDVSIEAAPVQPQQFQALTIGLAPEWQAKLQNIQGVGGSAVAIGCQKVAALDVLNDPAVLDGKNLVIIGHNSAWVDNPDYHLDKLIAERLLPYPLLLQGLGGKRFAEVAGLIGRGNIWNGESKSGIGSILTNPPIWQIPYPLNWPGNGKLEFYHEFESVYGVSGWYAIGVDIHTFVSTELGAIDSVFRFADKPAWYFGYSTIPDAWELWGLWCNIVVSLAA